MIKSSPFLLLSLSVLFSLPSTHAAPTRTHCLCSEVPAHHSNPLEPISDAQHHPNSQLRDLGDDNDIFARQRLDVPRDPCESLGPQLEYFRQSAPEEYAGYFPAASKAAAPTPSTSLDAELNAISRPVTTSVLLALAARNGYTAPESRSQIDETTSPVPSSSFDTIIVCRAAPSSIPELRFSKVTLWGLQCLVAMAVLGCISECISVVGQWFSTEEKEQQLRLQGSEQQIRAFAIPYMQFSSNNEKSEMKMCPACSPPPNSIEDEFDEDDEMNRPVL